MILRILPAKNTVYLWAVNALLALFVSFYPAGYSLWLMVLAGSALLWVLDGLRAFWPVHLHCERHLPKSVPVGLPHTVSLYFSHDSKQPITLQVYDHTPEHCKILSGLPLSVSLPPGQSLQVFYTLTPLQRGLMVFPRCQIRRLSPWRFWWRDQSLPVIGEVRVYPNFAAVAHYALLATDNQLSHLGIIKRRRRGEGQDFHQLREYRSGDSLRQIDWKASARMHKTIAREYQDERDQEIILMLDCGQRMQAKDDDLSHFDHTLNAALLLAHVALSQGDSVGLSAFASEPRWVKPRKGKQHLTHLLNTLYDLPVSYRPPDYHQAAVDIVTRQKKRALIILISNLRDEDTDDLTPALHLLRQRHLLLFVSLREQALDAQLAQPVDNLEDALNYMAAHHYMDSQKQVLNTLRAQNIYCMDVPPAHLSAQLINHYLDIKRSGGL